MSNQTQFGCTLAAELALHDWVASGERSYERLMALADYHADRPRGVSKHLPKVMVWQEALRLLRERIPDCTPSTAPTVNEHA
jgi:hypothetical protein